MPPSTVLITGANSGLGFEAARQLGMMEESRRPKKIILACRNAGRAKAAQESLQEITGQIHIYEILLIDVSDLDSCRTAAENVTEPVDAIILNAGGPGGKTPKEVNKDGVMFIMALNVLGQVLFVDELLKTCKIARGGTVVYVSSFAARGAPEIGAKPPPIETGSVEEWKSVGDGKKFEGNDNYTDIYGSVKLMGSMWTLSMARKHKEEYRFLTVAPGMARGTSGSSSMPTIQRWGVEFAMWLMVTLGKAHSVEVGAKRYVDVLYDQDKYKSGVYYGSKEGLTGEMADQAAHFAMIGNEEAQDNVNTALHHFLP